MSSRKMPVRPEKQQWLLWDELSNISMHGSPCTYRPVNTNQTNQSIKQSKCIHMSQAKQISAALV